MNHFSSTDSVRGRDLSEGFGGKDMDGEGIGPERSRKASEENSSYWPSPEEMHGYSEGPLG